jgi:uncharacterized iron-regulated protein
MLRWLLAACLMAIGACAPLAPSPPPDVLLLGEQHDALVHQRLHREVVETLAARGQLAALALEMADAGHNTAGLSADASAAQVQAALAWDSAGWPWGAYAPAVMAAVRAHVPVLGANLPRIRMNDAGIDASLDTTVPVEVLQAQQEAVRAGHCDLLPAAQVAPMVRLQLARDRAMAQAVSDASVPGKTVVLITGTRHADPSLGVPLHLRAGLRSESRLWPAQPPQRDYCAGLREQWRDPLRRSPPRS